MYIPMEMTPIVSFFTALHHFVADQVILLKKGMTPNGEQR
jgi:hypothetical protein